MGKRHKRAIRCIGCRLHAERCICNLIPNLATRTRLALVAHRRELRKTTNTGVLATRVLANAALFAWGEEDLAITPDELVPAGYAGIVLAPEAPPLSRAALDAAFGPDTPICLAVPDGSWRQATKMARRVPAMAALPRFSLPDERPTAYFLRHEPKDAGLATYEAIARAIGLIESPAIEAAMMVPFDALVAATLSMRGHTHGIP
jgi:DTW domain-containing protein YfiP